MRSGGRKGDDVTPASPAQLPPAQVPPLQVPPLQVPLAQGFFARSALDVARDLMIGHLDGDDEAAVMKRAIEAHASYTGVTLPAWRF